jgi:hypothetical protein
MSFFEISSTIILLLTAGFAFWQARSSQKQTEINIRMYEDSKKSNEITQLLLQKEFSVIAKLDIGFIDNNYVLIFRLINNSKRTITINGFHIKTEDGFPTVHPEGYIKYEIPKKLHESDEVQLVVERAIFEKVKAEKIKKIYFTDNNQKEYVIDKIYYEFFNQP